MTGLEYPIFTFCHRTDCVQGSIPLYGHDDFWTSHQFHIQFILKLKFLIAHCVSFVGETLESLGYFKFLLKSKTQAPLFNGLYKHKLKNKRFG